MIAITIHILDCCWSFVGVVLVLLVVVPHPDVCVWLALLSRVIDKVAIGLLF